MGSDQGTRNGQREGLVSISRGECGRWDARKSVKEYSMEEARSVFEAVQLEDLNIQERHLAAFLTTNMLCHFQLSPHTDV